MPTPTDPDARRLLLLSATRRPPKPVEAAVREPTLRDRALSALQRRVYGVDIEEDEPEGETWEPMTGRVR